jgi:septum site-determining protein MinD
MTTVHANNPKEAIGRLETLCMMAGMDLPAKAIREQISGSVNLIIQIQRLSDGTRKIISVSEVQGLQGDVVTQQEVFRFVEKGFDKNRKIIGQFQATGLIPKFIEKFEKRGLIIPKSLFSNDASSVSPAGQAQPTVQGATPSTSQGTQNQQATDIKKASGGSR